MSHRYSIIKIASEHHPNISLLISNHEPKSSKHTHNSDHPKVNLTPFARREDPGM